MKLNKIDLWLFKVLYLSVAGIIVTQVLNIDSATSFFYLLTFPLTIFLWLRSVRKTVTGTDLLMLGTVALAVIHVFLDSSISNADINFEYLKKLIIFIMTLLFFQTANRVCAGEELARFINRMVDVLTIYLIIMYIMRFPQMYIFNNRVSSYLTFRFTNPNLTCLFLVCFYMMQVYRLFTPDIWHRKVKHILMAMMLAWFIICTRSRNGLLVLVLFTAVSAWLIFKGKRNLRITSFWAWIIAVLPALFISVYMWVVNEELVQRMFSFAVGEGKGLDARVKIWSFGLRALWNSPIIGTYAGISGKTGASQMHNSHLDVAASYGIPVLIMVVVLLKGYLHQGGRTYISKNSYLYMLSFACAMLLGIGEAAVFSGGMAIYVLIGTFLLLARKEVR